MPTMVQELINLETGAWRTELLKRYFIDEECKVILGLPTSLAGCKDRVIWHHTSNGEYSVRTGYGVAMELQENWELGRKGTGGCSRTGLTDRRWQDVWRLTVPNKMKFFIWRCCNSSLAVRANLIRRRMKVEGSCVLCGDPGETEQHLFFECEFSRVMWYCSSLQLCMDSFSGMGFDEIWSALCNRFRNEARYELIMQECAFILWRIWKCRNASLFKGMAADPREGIQLVRQHILEFQAAQETPRSANPDGNEGNGVFFAGTPVRWRRPTYGVIKFNCDGAWCGKTSRGGYGWVARDFAGLLLAAGGEGNRLFNSAAMAEAAAVRAALVACREAGFENVEIESDSLSLIKMLNREIESDATLECFIHDISFLASQIGRVRFVFVKRQGNVAAHTVASYVTSRRGSFCWDGLGPEFLFNALAKDVNIRIRI